MLSLSLSFNENLEDQTAFQKDSKGEKHRTRGGNDGETAVCIGTCGGIGLFFEHDMKYRKES